jgi:hypothetical protein
VVSLKITADVEKLKFATTVAVHMTMLGWRLYDERARAPYWHEGSWTLSASWSAKMGDK